MIGGNSNDQMYRAYQNAVEQRLFGVGTVSDHVPAKLLREEKGRADTATEAAWTLIEALGIDSKGRPADLLLDAVDLALEQIHSKPKTTGDQAKRIAMLEAERGPGMKAPQPTITCDLGEYWE